LSYPKNVRFARIRLKGAFGSWYFFCRGDRASECGNKPTYAPDCRLPASWKPLLSPAVPTCATWGRTARAGSRGRRCWGSGITVSGSPLGREAGNRTPWLLPPELLFILSPHCRNTLGFSAQVASHVARLGHNTASPGGHGQKQTEIPTRANQGG